MHETSVGMILAAGFGTRLKELTSIRPKPLMEIGNKAIIAHQIAMLEKAGVKDIYINLHHQAEQITDAIKKIPHQATIHFSIEESILGTAGGIRRVVEKFKLRDTPMIVLHGDMICDYELAQIPEAFTSLVIAKNRMVDGYRGSVSIDKHQRIVELGAYFHSPATKMASGFFTGIHFLSAEALEVLSKSSLSCLISELYPAWLKSGATILGDVVALNYEDLGSPERLLKATLEWCQHKNFNYLGRSEHPLVNNEGIFVGKNVVIPPQTRLVAPVVIGDNACIEAEVNLGPNTVIGPHSSIGQGASLSNCLVMSDTKIEKDEVLDCIIALSKARVLIKN